MSPSARTIDTFLKDNYKPHREGRIYTEFFSRSSGQLWATLTFASWDYFQSDLEKNKESDKGQWVIKVLDKVTKEVYEEIIT